MAQRIRHDSTDLAPVPCRLLHHAVLCLLGLPRLETLRQTQERLARLQYVNGSERRDRANERRPGVGGHQVGATAV